MTESQWRDELREIGSQLDLGGDLTVWRGGIVRPSAPTSVPSSMGMENGNGSKRPRHQRGPAAGSWQGPTRRQGTPGGSRPSRSASPLVLGDLAADYERQAEQLGDHYPEARHWTRKEGIWIRVESALLPSYGGKALLCVALPFTSPLPRAWAFLKPPMCRYEWVGPRHTNFPDGSICAFHVEDGTWKAGYLLVSLLDLYSVWIVRQLHLSNFGRWPGHQFVPSAYERMSESSDNDLCGCGSGVRYGDCHKKDDLSRIHVPQATRMAIFDRHPPENVANWAQNAGDPPPL